MICNVVANGNVEVLNAEADKTAMVRRSEGKKQQYINIAEGKKQQEILEAEGAREASILRAEGEQMAIARLASVIKTEEGKRGQMLQIEEEELGFAPDAGAGGNASEAETDEKSEGSDGELCGKDRQDLVSDLIGAIDAPIKRAGPAASKSYRAPSKKAKPPKGKPKSEPVVKVALPAPRRDLDREKSRSIA